MKDFRTLNIGIVKLCLLASLAGCVSTPETKPLSQTMMISQQSDQVLTEIVAGIIADQQTEGRVVTIVGYYRGWDLLGEANQPPPVTRADWVVKDQSGALYIQANDVTIERQGTEFPGSALRGNDRESMTRIVRVTGVVRFTRKSQPYIEPTRIEILK